MTKAEFLVQLSERLQALPKDERARSVAYYDEMLTDRMEDGLTEAEAVSGMEAMDVIVERILSEFPGAVTRKRATGGGKGKTALIILGFPVWFPLLIGLAVVVLALIIVLWAVWFSVAAACVSFLVGGAVCILATPFFLAVRASSGVFQLGGGIAVLALGLMCYQPMRTLWQVSRKATTQLWNLTLKLFSKKEAV